MKTIGVVGSRRRNAPADFLACWEAFSQVYEQGDRVCSGMCPRGADQFAALFADIEDLEPVWYWAEWGKYGKGAGFIRNGFIAADSDVLIACVASDRKGGTEDTIKKFKKKHPNSVVYLV